MLKILFEIRKFKNEKKIENKIITMFTVQINYFIWY